MTARGLVVAFVKAVAAAIVIVPLVVLAAVEGVRTRLRRRARRLPRVVLGPEPIIALKYWSEALRALGFASRTAVRTVYDINRREDFDVVREETGPAGVWYEPFRDYHLFARVLLTGDVLIGFFDGGWLRHTALDRHEWTLLRLAGKRTLLCPYGSDVAVPGHLGPFEEAMIADYPATVANADAVTRRVDRLCRQADVVIRNIQPGYLPRWDVVWPNQLAIDTERWSPLPDGGPSDDGDVVVLHAPNHRRLKATDALVDAVDRLREEGLPVRLELLERRPNEEIRAAVRACDIVGEQFIAGYAMFAVEALAAGKPVLSNLSWQPEAMRAHPDFTECPIVDASPDTLVDRLRELVEDPARRRSLGEAGRRFALDTHSYAAIGDRWAQLVTAAWRPGDTRAALAEWPAPRR